MRWIAIYFMLVASAFADTHYVSLNGTNNPPYANWPDAATNIQWAVDAATAGDTVLVTNGTYNLTNTITISQAITNRSVNGRTNTFINGNYPAYTNGCFSLRAAVYLTGFTITNGFAATHGGGGIEVVKTTGNNSVISNCVIMGNSCPCTTDQEWGGGISMKEAGTVVDCIISTNSSYYGGGIFLRANKVNLVASLLISNKSVLCGGGIGMYGGFVSNCIIRANTCDNYGGGLHGDYVYGNPQIYDSTFIENRGLYGGGIMVGTAGFTDCIISNNSAGGYAGGVLAQGNTTLQNCTISSNCATGSGGGIFINYRNVLVQNCLVTKNVGDRGGGIYCSQSNAIIRSCTIVSNRAASVGGVRGYNATLPSLLTNCIVYANTATTTNNYCDVIANHSCSDPLFDGTDNITNDPMFVSKDMGNWRLRANSLCINAGTNQSWMTNAVDLAGEKRIRDGIVDMGAYEHVYAGTIFSTR